MNKQGVDRSLLIFDSLEPSASVDRATTIRPVECGLWNVVPSCAARPQARLVSRELRNPVETKSSRRDISEEVAAMASGIARSRQRGDGCLHMPGKRGRGGEGRGRTRRDRESRSTTRVAAAGC